MAGQKIGWRAYVDPGLDADAKAFITAAGINNTTQISAINTLVIQLKFYGIWSKMKALYPMVGGSSTSHRFNLKDPRAVDAAFYLDFNGTWTHSSMGAKPDGLTGYANTKMNLFTTVGGSSLSHSTYVRLNSFKGAFGGVYSPVLMGGWYDSLVLLQSISNTSVKVWMGNTSGEGMTGTVTSLGGMIMGNRNGSSTVFTLKKNEATISTSASFSVRNFPAIPYYIGAYNNNGTVGSFDSNEIAFYHIGDGMSDVDAANFYTAVQTYQTTLGRNIGTAITTVSDSSAIAFIAAAGITDVTQKNAINTLITDLKSAGIWTKMKALYPFVGGTPAQHRFNLKDPRDVDAAFRIVFYGGMTHTSLGMVSNYTTSYADTRLTPSTVLSSVFSQHVSVYSQTSDASPVNTTNSIGEWQDSTRAMLMKIRSLSNVFSWEVGNGGTSVSNTDGKGFYLGSVVANNSVKLYKNNTNVATNTTTFSGSLPTQMQPIGKNENKTFSFASIGDGLTDTEATAFYNAVQKYQTILGRHIGTPLLPSGQTAGLLDTYSDALVAYSLRKLRSWYYGAAIRVRRSSDNTEQDIYFDASGNLDTASLLTFVGSGSGYVAKWYDQSGRTNHLIKISATNQPRIVNAGVLETIGGKPAVRWTLISNIENLLSMTTPLTNVRSVFLNITYLSGSTYAPLLGHSSFYDYHSNTLEYLNGTHASSYVLNGTKYINGVSKTNATFTKSTSNSLISMIHTSASGRVDQISSDRTVGVNVGEYRCFSGYYSEIVLYSSDQTANRAAIESNINSYYSIY
jgi:hypothetical protein